MATVLSGERHWREIARRWDQVGPPLRPSSQDVAVYASTAERRSRPRGLILGVTPEIYRLPWPDGTDVVALDHTHHMIEAVWPGPRGRAICADWTTMPLTPACRDVALCDGGLHLLSHPVEQRALVDELARVLGPDGLCALRLFVPPSEPETADAVLADLLAGKVPNLNVLKLRLGMALQESPAQGVELSSVWNALCGDWSDYERLARRIGWEQGHLSAIDSYRGSRNRYYFVTVGQVVDLFCVDPGGFETVAVEVPTYHLGERCPTVVLRRSS